MEGLIEASHYSTDEMCNPGEVLCGTLFSMYSAKGAVSSISYDLFQGTVTDF